MWLRLSFWVTALGLLLFAVSTLYPQFQQLQLQNTPLAILTGPYCCNANAGSRDTNTFTARFQPLAVLRDLGSEGDDIWNSQLLPAGGGLLMVKVNNTGERDDLVKEEGWGISMFHSLHCLQMIREVLKASKAQKDHEHLVHLKGSHVGHDVRHTTHCLSYLYQVSPTDPYN